MSQVYEWKSKENIPITLTVAHPLKHMERISWLAFESLRRQESIDFGWELIVFEDGNDSEETLMNFIGKLPGCQRVYYNKMNKEEDGRLFLIDKWVGIARVASRTSLGYVMQAGDVYSPTKRLHIHNEHFKNKDCYFSMYPRGMSYDIRSGKKIFYDAYSTDKVYHNNGYFGRLHFMKAVRTRDMRKVPIIDRNRRIDKHIRLSILAMNKIDLTSKKVIFSADEIDPGNWRTGFNTDGMNIISNRRPFYENPVRTWKPYTKRYIRSLNYNKGFKKFMPEEVYSFLMEKQRELVK